MFLTVLGNNIKSIRRENMKINLVGKNINITQDIKDEVEKKFDRLNKYFDDQQAMDVKISQEGNDYKVESTIILDGGTILRAESMEETYQNSIDRTMDALVRQIRKHKTRLLKHRNSGSIKFENFNESFDSEYNIDDSYDDDEIKIVREKEVKMKPMSDQEAAMQMELLNHDFYVYQDDQDMNLRIVYRRKNGGYGVIIPTQR